MTARIPPHDVDTEQALIGSMLVATSATREALGRITASDLYVAAHRLIFEAIERLHVRGAAVDPTTVAVELGDNLERVGGRQQLAALHAEAPASVNAQHYASIVAEKAACRRAIEFGRDIADAGYESDLDTVVGIAQEGLDRLAPPAANVAPAEDLLDLLAAEITVDWLVPDLLARRERVMVTGGEGQGKSVLLEMIASCLALGVHPWTHVSMPRSRVLVVEFDNSRGKLQRVFRWMLDQTSLRGRAERGWMAVQSREQGMDLTKLADVRWLDALMAHHQPDCLAFGPLYKAHRGRDGRAKSGEETAEIVSEVLDELRVKYDCALLLENHAGHGDANDRNGYRPRGSSLWLGWPDVGFGMKPIDDGNAMRLVPWRGDREGRAWPSVIRRGRIWPWEVEQ